MYTTNYNSHTVKIYMDFFLKIKCDSKSGVYMAMFREYPHSILVSDRQSQNYLLLWKQN